MKLVMIVLTLPFLMSLSSCTTTKVEYVDRIVYKEPLVPQYSSIMYPSVPLVVWGDYAVYKAQCEAKINQCNSNMQSIYNSISLSE